MSDAGIAEAPTPASRRRFSLNGWRNRLVSSRGFQSWASRFPLTRGTARREGEAMFDLVAGFVHSQVLMALVELGVLDTLRDGPQTLKALAHRHRLADERMEILAQAGAALGLLNRRGDRVSLTRRGAALLGVPGLAAMIRHHRVLYRDLENPVAFLRGETKPELAGFWPYVFGPGADVDPEAAERYSDLMTDSQALVAEETLRAVSFRGTKCLMDVGGGTGVFLASAAQANPDVSGVLFDLPEVAAQAARRFARDGLSDRLSVVPGSFRTDPLPGGADTISLVRVLYDHSDTTVAALLAAVFAALPPGGRVVVSEPMSGGARPDRATDTYFALYTLAMGTGRTRSAARICSLLAAAGFAEPRALRTARPFVTSVVTAVRPG
ncbi:methyltransferase [Palleronia sp. KMU-117]|uniref:methyltransferase n=1 Tax=Palleronia sp. KMU-117 TaxID=3434108 RepID=UPI003D714076